MEKNWTSYESEKEKFKALFPGHVNREYNVLPNIRTDWQHDDGTSPGSVVYRSKTGHFLGKLIYQISVIRIKVEFDSQNLFCEAALEEIVDSNRRTFGTAELKSHRWTIFKGYDALEYEIDSGRYGRQGTVGIKGIMMAVKNTIYNLHVEFLQDLGGGPRAGHEPELEKFINSFEILR